jgi:hypothetical protein
MKEEKRMKKQQQAKKQETSQYSSGSSMEFEPKSPLPDTERDARIAAFQASPIWNKYQNYSYLHETGYRNTFPLPNPHLAYTLGRSHAEYVEPTREFVRESMVVCPTAIRATSSHPLFLRSADNGTSPVSQGSCPPLKHVPFPRPRSFHSFQPRPKSGDFSSLGPRQLPEKPELVNKRPREVDSVDRLKADFLSSSPRDLGQTRCRITLPPITSFLPSVPIHEVVCLFNSSA